MNKHASTKAKAPAEKVSKKLLDKVYKEAVRKYGMTLKKLSDDDKR